MDRIGKALRLVEIGLARFPPQEIGIRGVGETTRDRVFDTEPWTNAEKALGRALMADEWAVALVDIAGQQLRRLRICICGAPMPCYPRG